MLTFEEFVAEEPDPIKDIVKHLNKQHKLGIKFTSPNESGFHEFHTKNKAHQKYNNAFENRKDALKHAQNIRTELDS